MLAVLTVTTARPYDPRLSSRETWHVASPSPAHLLVGVLTNQPGRSPGLDSSVETAFPDLDRVAGAKAPESQHLPYRGEDRSRLSLDSLFTRNFRAPSRLSNCGCILTPYIVFVNCIQQCRTPYMDESVTFGDWRPISRLSRAADEEAPRRSEAPKDTDPARAGFGAGGDPAYLSDSLSENACSDVRTSGSVTVSPASSRVKPSGSL